MRKEKKYNWLSTYVIPAKFLDLNVQAKKEGILQRENMTRILLLQWSIE